MKRRIILGVTLMAGLLALVACGTKAVPSAKLTAVGGKVSVDGKAASSGLGLNAGETLRVEAGGFARLLFPDGSKQFLYPHPKTGEALVYTLEGPEEEAQAKTMICNLASGVVAFLVPKKRQSPVRFRIQAQHTITAIRGTEGKVETTAEGDQVALKNGVVEVSQRSGEATMTLQAGQRLEASSSGELSGPFLYDFSADREKKLYLKDLPDMKSF